jgi:beta-phosphoglucomutase
MADPRGILFDFNGVLVDDEPQHCRAFIATLAEHAIVIDEAGYYRDHLGSDDRTCFANAWREAGRTLTDTLLKLLVKQKSERYERAIREHLTMVNGAAEFVTAAATAGFRLGIVSGALRREIDLVLDVTGLRRYFPLIIAAEDVRACKPDPEGYRRALEALALPARDVMVLEDSLPGLAAARAAGMRCTMLATSHERTMLSDAELVWDDLSGRRPMDLPWP